MAFSPIWIVIVIGVIALWFATPRKPGEHARMVGESHMSVLREVVMPMLISLIVLGAALWIILHGGYGEFEQKWAAGAIGTVVGFWLRSTAK